MVIIHEIASKKIVPALKGVIIHELYRQGFSQRRIASLLNITQPQVYKYLCRNIEHYLKSFREMGFEIDRVKYYVSIIVDLLKNEKFEKYILLVNSVVHELALNYVCREYSVPDTLCREKRFTDPHIEYYREWLERITSLPGLYRLIPEVGSNLVYAPSKPLSISDVIGLTGRIIRAGERVEVVGEPFYGGSRHLSKILVLASKYDESKRVAMNISFNIDVSILEDRWVVKYSGPHDSLDKFWTGIEDVLRHKPDIVVDRGGYGLEPVVYVITRDFRELENILKHILSHKQ